MAGLLIGAALLVAVLALWYRLQYHNPPPFGAHEVIPRLWLGNFEDSLQVDELRRRNITHILSVATGLYPHHRSLTTSDDREEWQGFEHMVIRVMDKDGQDLLTYLPIAHDFIKEGHDSGGSVLVHCMAGISRSATCLISYIMRAEGLSFEKTLELTQSKRSIVNPNAGFRRQLEVFERLLEKEKQKMKGDSTDEGENATQPDENDTHESSYTKSWMRAEIVRWHPREKRLEVVQQHDGDWSERIRGWLTHVGTGLWAYNFRRFGKAVQRFWRSWNQRPKAA